jgi:two-component system, OmpR family, alkaline phosphatase synthesis response regulator PhoP
MKPLSVLIIEDDSLTASLLTTLFERHHFAVTLQTNGKDALEYIGRTSSVDIVILDLLLPVVNGYTILEHIRNNENWNHTEVIVLSAKDHPSDREHALALGANAYWLKPFDPDGLITSILNSCHQHRAA